MESANSARRTKRSRGRVLPIRIPIPRPTPAKTPGGIGPKGVNEDIQIGQDHRLAVASSRSPDLFRSIPGNVPPEAVETGNRTGFRGIRFGSANTISSPSSTSDVSVRPCSAALFFAFRSSASGSLIVVLISQRILPTHQYVENPGPISLPSQGHNGEPCRLARDRETEALKPGIA
jgi:hypothetical protein